MTYNPYCRWCGKLVKDAPIESDPFWNDQGSGFNRPVWCDDDHFDASISLDQYIAEVVKDQGLPFGSRI